MRQILYVENGAPFIPPPPAEPYWLDLFGTIAMSSTGTNGGAGWLKTTSFGPLPLVGNALQIKLAVQPTWRFSWGVENATDEAMDITTHFDVSLYSETLGGVATNVGIDDTYELIDSGVAAFDGRLDLLGVSGRTHFHDKVATMTEVLDSSDAGILSSLNTNRYLIGEFSATNDVSFPGLIACTALDTPPGCELYENATGTNARRASLWSRLSVLFDPTP